MSDEHGLAPPTLRETANQAGRYLIGACAALAIDTVVVTVGVKLGVPALIARLAGLSAGVTTTYFFNRRVTFSPQHPASLKDWGQYVARQSVGTALNFALSYGLIYLSSQALWQIWGAIAIGAAAGFCINFFSARRQLHR